MTATTAYGTGVTDLEDLVEAALLSEATEIESVLREGEIHKLRIAYQWAIAHPPVDARETAGGHVLPAVLTAPETLGGEGTPEVAAFTSEPLAGAVPESVSLLSATETGSRPPLPAPAAPSRSIIGPTASAGSS